MVCSGKLWFCMKLSKKWLSPDISSIMAKSSRVVSFLLASWAGGMSMRALGPSFCRSTIKSSSYSLCTSKCSITILWHSLFLLSQYCQLYRMCPNVSSLSLLRWIPYLDKSKQTKLKSINWFYFSTHFWKWLSIINLQI